RVDVGQRTYLLDFAASLLGGHVIGRAHQGAAFGLTGVFRQSLGQTKVGDFGNAIDCQKDVGGFQIPVDDAALVGVLHGLSEGLDHVGSVARRLGFAMDLGIQTAAAHEFQREKGQAVVLTVFVDLNDIGML